MTTEQRIAVTEGSGLPPAASNAVTVEAPACVDDRQNRLDKIEFLIGVYRMRYMHYVWHDHLPEAGEMERKIDRLLDRWKRVHDCEASA
jgi:hypothetical protein